MKDKIRAYLNAECPWSDTLHWYPQTDSTNIQAKALAKAGAPHGTVLIAGHQTGGRGRMGRTFQSPEGKGVYLSVILRPGCQPEDLMHLTCAAGVAKADAVEAVSGIRPGLKWINDLVIGTRKLGGILVEMSVDKGLVDYAVVGIGINCNQAPEDFPPELQQIACSAAMVLGAPVDRSRLAAAMILSLERMSQTLLTDRQNIMSRYRSGCITIGTQVTVLQGDDRKDGHALDILDDGSLLVTFADGHTAAVNSGEVSVRGLYGYT